MTGREAKDQTIFRVAHREQSFTTIGNGVLQHWSLPLDVRGFLACILSLPTDWHFRVNWFFRKNGCGKDRGYRIMKSLIDAGYAQRSPIRRGDGTIIKWSYIFTDQPGDFGPPQDQLPVFQEVDDWPIKRAPRPAQDQLPGLPLLGQPELGQPDLANGTLQKTDSHKSITGTKKSSARVRARRPFRSDHGKEGGSLVLTPSPDAIARGLKLASGWDKDWLLSQFFEMNSREDADPVRNVDAAWIGFCRHQGANPDKPAFKFAGKAVPLDPPPLGLVPIVRLGAEWQHWLDHLDKCDREIADRMRSSRTFMVYVPTRLPQSSDDRPTFPRAKAET